MEAIKNTWIELRDEVSKWDLFDLAGIMSILMLMLFITSEWYIKVPITVIGISGIIIPSLRKKPEFWFVSLVFLISINTKKLWSIDNHKYLEMYWIFCLFIVANLRSVAEKDNKPALNEQADDVLMYNGRMLLGLAMGIAVFWKVINAEYMSGAFFEFTLLTDSRFDTFVHLFTSLSMEQLDTNAGLESKVYFGTKETVMLHTSAGLKILAQFMTWWTIIIESIIAFLFLYDSKSKVYIFIRHATLIAFIASTYMVATVGGFAWLITIMAVASCGRKNADFRLAYIFAFLLTQAYRLPFGMMIEAFKQ